MVEVGKAWQKKKADGGWACLHWPKEYGGRGATPIERVIGSRKRAFRQADSAVPDRRGHVRADRDGFGSEEHKRRYLPKLASGEEIWCQLLRAGRWFRCRGSAYPGRAERRRLDRQWPEDLDLRAHIPITAC